MAEEEIMATATGVEVSSERKVHWQVSLADLIFLVLAAGLAAGVVRGARDVWGTSLTRWSASISGPSARTAGVAVEIASVWLALILARGMLALVRGPRS